MWKKFCKAAALEPGGSLVVKSEGHSIALFHAEGRLFAVDNTCPHRGGPLEQGHVDEGVVTCPWHAWTFDLKTGTCGHDSAIKQKTYQVKVEEGEILLDL